MESRAQVVQKLRRIARRGEKCAIAKNVKMAPKDVSRKVAFSMGKGTNLCQITWVLLFHVSAYISVVS